MRNKNMMGRMRQGAVDCVGEGIAGDTLTVKRDNGRQGR